MRQIMIMMLLWILASSAAAQEDTGGVMIDLAPVDRVQIEEGEDSDEITVTAEGNLPDGCTSISDLEILIDERVISIALFTERPLDAFCTQALVPYAYPIPLDVSDLEDGIYTVEVNGVEATYARGISAGAQAAESSECGVDDEETVVFRNGDLGYCVRVPRDATIEGTYPSPLLLSTPAARIIISSAPADGRTLNDILDGITSANTEAVITETSVDETPAALVEAEEVSRELVVIHAGTVFRFTLRADDLADEDTTALWETVTESLTLFEPDEIESFDARPLTTTVLEDLNLELQLPEDWRVQAGEDGTFGLYAPDSDTPLVTFSITEDFEDVDLAEADMLALTEGTGRAEPYFNAREMVGTVIYGVPQACQQIILMGEPAFRQITIDPAACGAPNSTVIVDPVVRGVLGFMQEPS